MSIERFLCWLEDFDMLINSKYSIEVLLSDDDSGEQFIIHNSKELLTELSNRNIGLLDSEYVLSIISIQGGIESEEI